MHGTVYITYIVSVMNAVTPYDKLYKCTLIYNVYVYTQQLTLHDTHTFLNTL